MALLHGPTLTELRTVLGEDLDGLLHLYAGTLPSQVHDLREAHRHDDTPRLQRCAHSLKGSSLSVGAQAACGWAFASWLGFLPVPAAGVAALTLAAVLELGRNTVTSITSLAKHADYAVLGAAPRLTPQALRSLPPDQRSPPSRPSCLSIRV